MFFSYRVFTFDIRPQVRYGFLAARSFSAFAYTSGRLNVTLFLIDLFFLILLNQTGKHRIHEKIRFANKKC